jgi:hypothetical protein
VWIAAMSARPRGFIDGWRQRVETQALLDRVIRVLAEYAERLPLTLHQIFYRLVGVYDYEKNERAYGRLGETLNKARRARFVAMDAVRDDGFTSAVPITFEDEDGFFAAVGTWAQHLRLDRQRGQPRRLALWCEASGMVPQLQRIAEPFGVGVYSGGGFDSLTDKHRIGREWSGDPVTVLHLGDHDPSGVHCFSALDEDVVAFAQHYGGDIEFSRLAVTPAQSRQYRLPSAPQKETDRRRFEGNETWQIETLDPRELANIVRTAIEARLNRAIFDEVIAEEEDIRQAMLSQLGRR